MNITEITFTVTTPMDSETYVAAAYDGEIDRDFLLDPADHVCAALLELGTSAEAFGFKTSGNGIDGSREALASFLAHEVEDGGSLRLGTVEIERRA